MQKINHFPTSTGVYIMKDRDGMVLYVGKAKNLRSRIKQYFTFHDERVMIPFLIKKIADIDTIVVSSEKEALLLENTLIKKYKPKYNACLKDDKGYIYIKITKDMWPTLSIVNYKEKKAGEQCFGPYTSKKAAKKTTHLIYRIFQLRQCSVRNMNSRKRACILHQMGRCLAPCANHCSKEEYDTQLKLVTKFLRGQNKQLLKELYAKMQKESGKLHFEKAKKTLDIIQHIEKALDKQKIDLLTNKNIHVIATFGEENKCILAQLFFNRGVLSDINIQKIDNKFQDEASIVRLFIMQYYTNHDIPHEIIIPEHIEDKELIEEILSEKAAHKVKISVPQRGKKLELVEMARQNAEKEFWQNKQNDKEELLLKVQKKLLLKNFPKRIECFDTSHHAGEGFVAGMTTFIDGEAAKQFYRKYKIKTEMKDDYHGMQEVLTRRYSKQDLALPDLIIVDGGRGQLNIAKKTLKELNLTIDIVALAKEKGRHDKGLTSEQIHTPTSIIKLPKDSTILFLLQNIRDETHRFTITFHRHRFRKSRQS